MKKYYLIPMVLEKDLYIKDNSLFDILNSSYPELVRLEEARIRILYSISPLIDVPEDIKKKYNDHLVKTNMMYEQKNIPYYLIAYGSDKCAKELITDTKITSKYDSALGIRSVSMEEINNYLINSHYEEKVLNLFNIKNNKIKTKRI